MAKMNQRNAKRTSPAPKAPAAPAKTTAPQPTKTTSGQAQSASVVETKSGTATRSETARAITQSQIAEAAYARWQRFGGDAEKNWFEAERELRGA